jgi:hypothetical protein
MKDVQAVVRLHFVDSHCAGVAVPAEDAPSLGGLVEAISLVDVVAIARSRAPAEIKALAGGHVLDVVAAKRGHESEFLVAATVGIVGDDVRPSGAVVVVDVEDALLVAAVLAGFCMPQIAPGKTASGLWNASIMPSVLSCP